MRRLRRFVVDPSAVSAIEFAFLAPLFLSLLFAIFQIALFYYAQAGVSYAAKSAARQIMIGNVHNTPGISAALFRTKFFCAALPPGLDCNNVVVDVEQAVYQNFGCCFPSPPPLDNSQTKFCIGKPGAPGAPGSVIFVQAYYALPTPKLSFLPLPYQTYLGHSVLAPGAISVVLNEPFQTSYISPC